VGDVNGLSVDISWTENKKQENSGIQSCLGEIIKLVETID
jgi:hypothetical protein